MNIGRQFLIFGLAGTAGFIADVGALYLALHAGLGYFAGRLLSFLFAVMVTWTINRRFTFDPSTKGGAWHQWWKYLGAMSVGGTVNYAVYSVIVVAFPDLVLLPFFAIMAGTCAGMLINFSTAKWWVFKS